MSQTMAVLNDSDEVTNIVIMADSVVETSTLIAYTKENPAHIGGDYFEGAFYPPKPFNSWLRDGNGSWVAPIPYPEDGGNYTWDEETGDWLEVTDEAV